MIHDPQINDNKFSLQLSRILYGYSNKIMCLISIKYIKINFLKHILTCFCIKEYFAAYFHTHIFTQFLPDT